MKRLIVVGNKMIDEDISEEVDSFDYVVRLNRMSNYGKTGFKTDLLLADFHPGFFQLVEKPYDKYKTAKQLLVNVDLPLTAYVKGLKQGIVTQRQLQTSKKISMRAIAEQLLGKQDWNKTKMMPTNYFLLTKHMIDNYSSQFEIWTAGVDISDRDVLFNTAKQYEGTWHTSVGQFESNMLHYWIDNNMLHVLNCKNI